jgi:putative serine protease PepD
MHSYSPIRSYGPLVAALAVIAALLIWRGPWSAAANAPERAQNHNANVAVACEPGEQAVIQQSIVNGSPQVNVLCAPAGALQPAAAIAPAGEAGQPREIVHGYAPAQPVAPAAYPAGPYPATYVVPAAQPAPVPVATAAPAQAPRAPARTSARSNSWQRRALVIGGSAGAGAGIGGLIGGKKGALIGAAIGGGSASLYEAMKDR